MSTDSRPMTAVVEFQIRTETTSLDAWLDEWHRRAQDAFEFEPETSAYEACVNVADPSRVLIFERYARGQASLKTHMERAAHATLNTVMGEHNMTKRRVLGNVGADLPDFGWWSRPEFSSALRTPDLPLILLDMAFESTAQRDQFIALSAEHAHYCFDAEPETLIYSGAIALHEAKPDAPAQKGNLLFAMACTDAAAVDKHATDPKHLALGEKLAAAGINVEGIGMFEYRTTGRGYLWR